MKCESCGGPMLRRPHNSECDVALCDDYNCPLFRRPIAIEKADKTLADELVPLIRRKKHPRRRREFLYEDEDEDNRFLEKLRRLREEISTKKEDPEVL